VVNTVVFLWISASAPVAPSTAARAPIQAGPTREALSTLSDFGAARGISFVPPTEAGRPLGLPANDAAIVDAIEAELEQARTALSALEEASAGARLSWVEGQLLAHPHLPQAAFLMGECLALQAQAEREHSLARASALEARRAAIEGPRATPFGAPIAAPSGVGPLELRVTGLSDADELELDGATWGRSRRLSVQPGLHHARVWRRGRPIFAAFLEVAPQQSALELSPPPLVPCDREDLDEAARDATASGVACERWVKVRDEKPGIGVAFCEHERCRPFTHWQRRAAPSFAPIRAERAPFPAWAGFTIASAAAAVVTGLVLWQSGAFEHGRPSAATWEYGGLNPQPLRF
jgi:hypothetical protein